MQRTTDADMPPTGFNRWAGTALLCFALVAGGVLRVWYALHDYGINWPDEIFMSLEPAHRLVFGYGLQGWEFVEGARNWALPGLIAGIFKCCSILGMDAPEYILVIRMVFVAVGVATTFGCWNLARSLGASSITAAIGAILFALAAPAIFFAPRAMSETASMLPLVFGFALALPKQARKWQKITGSSLLGFAVLLRMQNGVFCAGLLVILAARREWRSLLLCSVVLMLWAFFYGLLDWLTWGHWFQSALLYLKFNLVEGNSSDWGTAPFWYYAGELWSTMGLSLLVVAAFFLLAVRRSAGLALVTAVFLLLHSFIPHKELRFILPALPLLCALAGAGLEIVASGLPPVFFRSLVLVVLVIAAMNISRYQTLASGQIGSDSVNRLLLIAGKQSDLEGLKVEIAGRDWTGGYSYLHKDVPLYGRDGPARESLFYNYVITDEEGAQGGEVVAHDHDTVLVRISRKKCLPDPGFKWRVS